MRLDIFIESTSKTCTCCGKLTMGRLMCNDFSFGHVWGDSKYPFCFECLQKDTLENLYRDYIKENSNIVNLEEYRYGRSRHSNG